MMHRRVSPAALDARGSITDILQDTEIHHATVIESCRGAVRGNHYHLRTVQYVYLLRGRLLVRWRMPGCPVQSMELVPGDLIAHPPQERHAVEALEDSTFLVLTEGPRGGDHYESDTYREAVE